MVRIAKGLKQSFTNATEMSVDEVVLTLKTRTDCYEVLNDTHNRIYLDIDGKVEGLDVEQFAIANTQVNDALTDYFGNDDEYCLMTASSYLHHKISWRVVMKYVMSSKEDNKIWAKNLKIDLPDGVKIDLGVYDKNRKMRMLGSNKDGENRPLKLVKGDAVDTIISHIDGCTLKEHEKKETKRGRPTKKQESKLLPIFDLLPIELIDEYDTWVKIGMICKNSDETLDVFKQVSSRSAKYNERECEKKWETFVKSALTIWKFLKEHAVDVYERVKQNDYEYMKEDFENTHFKVMNPPMIIRLTASGGLQQLAQKDFAFMYKNLMCNGESFTNKWLSDPTIRTYESLVFLPKQTAPHDQYNIFKGFPVEAVEGDVTIVNNLLKMITGNDDKVYKYVEKWVASILQKPYEKTGVVLVNQGNQGVGKDTFFNFVGSMFGVEYFMNTGNAENDVWGRFTDHQQRVLFMKFEEASFVSNKTHADKLKNLITAEKRSFEGKGLKPITLNNYTNLVMTTNQEVPVLLEDTDRRFCCFKASDEKRGDFEYWNAVHTALNNPATRNAYYHYLMNVDLTGFNPRDFPKTDYYETIREALAPHHARFFQRIVEDCLQHEADTQDWDARRLFNRVKEDCKFDYQETKFGMDMKKYPEDALIKKRSNKGNKYVMNAEKMMDFLKSKNWWADL